MKKWELIHRNGIGAFGYEVYRNTVNSDRYLVKVFVYDKPVLLSGDREILGGKLAELTRVFQELQELFPEPNEPPL